LPTARAIYFFILISLRFHLQFLLYIQITIEAINLPSSEFFVIVSHRLLQRLLPASSAASHSSSALAMINACCFAASLATCAACYF